MNFWKRTPIRLWGNSEFLCQLRKSRYPAGAKYHTAARARIVAFLLMRT